MKAEEILQGYNEAEKNRISLKAHQLGIAPDDPMFQLMATLGRYEETMIDLQARMEGMVEAWATLIDQKLEATSKAANSMHHTVVSNAVREEFKKINPTSAPATLSSTSKLGFWAICGGLMAAGTVLGSLTTWNLIANLGSTQSVVVSPNELKILQWAKSNQGKALYQLILDNESAITACQQENRLKGYCLIRMKPVK